MGFPTVGVARQEEEFFAAPADHRIGKPGGRIDAMRDLDQDLISDLVPELVVDLLEVVDVDQIEDKITIANVGGYWIAGKRAQDLLHVGLDRVGEEPPVPSAGEQVGQGSVEQLPIGIG